MGGGVHKLSNPCVLRAGPFFFLVRAGYGRVTSVCSFSIEKYYAILRRFSRFSPPHNCNLIPSPVPYFPGFRPLLSLTLPLPCPPPLTSLIPTMFCGFSQHLCLWCTLITLIWSLIPPLSSLTSPHWYLIRPRNGQDYCTRTGPTIPQKDRWSLYVPPSSTLKDGVLFV